MTGVATMSWSVRVSRWWSVLVVLFLLLPLLAIVLMSLSPGRILEFPPRGFGLQWYAQVLTSDSWAEAAVNSVVVALITVAISMPSGAGLAIAVWRLPSRWRGTIGSLVLSPMVVPVIVMALALFFTMADLGLLGTRLGLGLGHALISLPLVFLATTTALDYFDEHLIDAAQSLGASRLYAWLTVLLPLVGPAVILGGLLAFLNSFDEAVVAIFVGRGTAVTIPNLMWRSLNVELTPDVAAVSTIISAVGLVIQFIALMVFARIVRRIAATRAAGA
jgi:putative spermidine/putrescine transport system permease protein